MRARIYHTCDCTPTQYKEFANYDELVKYCFTLHDRIILFNKQRYGYEPTAYDVEVEIYDDYRE